MRESIIALSAVAAAVASVAPTVASVRHKTSSTHHMASIKHAMRRHDESRKPSTSSGARAVPAGGIKLSCDPGKSPLMVRKMTQGAGTIVTVVCR